ncbi:hypothetical protein [Luteolibacter soli]|uniref:Cytochrome c domain-containing protein n=1 Tax=Luteolibacter soli TaxID=3135280 RepID=A0ABU9AUA3_9BACT
MKSLPLLLLLSASLPSIFEAKEKPGPSGDHEIVIEKELLITALEVVNGPEATYPGPWSFGHLMDEALGEKISRKTVATWLDSWAKGSPENATFRLPPREALEERLIAPWRQRDQLVDCGDWLPDFAHAPFRLLAIVNRMDLGEHALPTTPVPTSTFNDSSGYGPAAGNLVGREAGEARFVFAAVDLSGQPLPGGTTIILEYGLDAPTSSPGKLADWAKSWHALGAQPAFDDTYRAKLVEVTRRFTKQLLRIRVNDGAFGDVREFREFHLQDGKLVPAQLPGTPNDSYFVKGSADNRSLTEWVAKQRVPRESEIDNPRAAKTEIPASFPLPASFQATIARVPDNDASFHWDGWGMRDEGLRRAFSMQTCCGCHCGDTSTAFFHIAPTPAETEATLSKFMRTDGSRWRPKDPSNGRGFLSSEMEDRKMLLERVLKPNPTNRELNRIREVRNGRFH